MAMQGLFVWKTKRPAGWQNDDDQMEKHVNYVSEIHKPVLNQDTLLQEHTKFH